MTVVNVHVLSRNVPRSGYGCQRSIPTIALVATTILNENVKAWKAFWNYSYDTPPEVFLHQKKNNLLETFLAPHLIKFIELRQLWLFSKTMRWQWHQLKVVYLTQQGTTCLPSASQDWCPTPGHHHCGLFVLIVHGLVCESSNVVDSPKALSWCITSARCDGKCQL